MTSTIVSFLFCLMRSSLSSDSYLKVFQSKDCTAGKDNNSKETTSFWPEDSQNRASAMCNVGRNPRVFLLHPFFSPERLQRNPSVVKLQCYQRRAYAPKTSRKFCSTIRGAEEKYCSSSKSVTRILVVYFSLFFHLFVQRPKLY